MQTLPKAIERDPQYRSAVAADSGTKLRWYIATSFSNKTLVKWRNMVFFARDCVEILSYGVATRYNGFMRCYVHLDGLIPSTGGTVDLSVLQGENIVLTWLTKVKTYNKFTST